MISRDHWPDFYNSYDLGYSYFASHNGRSGAIGSWVGSRPMATKVTDNPSTCIFADQFEEWPPLTPDASHGTGANDWFVLEGLNQVHLDGSGKWFAYPNQIEPAFQYPYGPANARYYWGKT